MAPDGPLCALATFLTYTLEARTPLAEPNRQAQPEMNDHDHQRQNASLSRQVFRCAAHPLGSIALAIVLFGVALALAHRSPSHDDIASASAAYNLLVVAALPWTLQWSAIALLLVALTRQRLHIHRTHLLYAILTPLVVGMCWWISWTVLFWQKDPFEASLEFLARKYVGHMSGYSFWEIILFDVLGPLVCPLQLAGPVGLRGWDFLWVGLSTAIVMVYWAWASGWSRMTFSFSLTRGQFFRILLVNLIYYLPVILHAAILSIREFG